MHVQKLLLLRKFKQKCVVTMSFGEASACKIGKSKDGYNNYGKDPANRSMILS